MDRPKWCQRKHDRTHYLKTYRLTTISGEISGPAVTLVLWDGDDGGSGRTMSRWHLDRCVWDLLYNGRLHSTVNGAEIDRTAIDLLKFDDSVALQLRNENPRDC